MVSVLHWDIQVSGLDLWAYNSKDLDVPGSAKDCFSEVKYWFSMYDEGYKITQNIIH